MKNFERSYNSWKLFGGKKRDAELERLANEMDDFNFRRLYVEENEKWLHVFFSRRKFSIYAMFTFLSLGIVFWQYPFFSLLMSIISFKFFVFSLIYKRKFKLRAGRYQFGLKMVDIVINSTYGISL